MLKALLLLVGLYASPIMAVASPPPMPAVVVLIVCKVKTVSGPADQNADKTNVENLEWDTTDAVMHCRRQEVSMYDQAADQGADPQPFNQNICQRSALILGPTWDAQHKSSKYRFWRVACPVTIVATTIDGHEYIKGWKIPDCGEYQGTVVCEQDTTI